MAVISSNHLGTVTPWPRDKANYRTSLLEELKPLIHENHELYVKWKFLLARVFQQFLASG